MSRSGYSDDIDDPWTWIMWRGRVSSAIRGKRGQEFFKALIAALDAMPEKRLIADELEHNGEVCALGCLGKQRGFALDGVDPDDHRKLSEMFNIAPSLVAEVEYMNDEHGQTPELRWSIVRKWAEKQLIVTASPARSPRPES